jgi:intracellular septation protein A
LFSLNSDRFKFDLDGVAYEVELRVEGEDWVYVVERDGVAVYEEKRALRASEFYLPYGFEVHLPEGRLRFVAGAISSFSFALEVYQEDKLYWRSSEKPFKSPTRAQGLLEWLDRQNEKSHSAKTPEQLRREEDAKRLRPALAVDIVFGVLFFFVAREYGLVSAAVLGACATFALVIVDRFVKPDLTGGFAVFGAIMALISAGLALSLQDELAVKLRGSIMGLIGASFMFVDWLNDGRYLGRRFARYFYAFGAINPKRASLAVCVSGLLLVAIDTPLAFTLSTAQWIWYNAFLDSLIAIPIVLGAMWFAKER